MYIQIFKSNFIIHKYNLPIIHSTLAILNFTRTLEIIIDFLAVSVVLADIYGMATCRQGIDGVGIRLCKKEIYMCENNEKSTKFAFHGRRNFDEKKLLCDLTKFFLRKTEPEIKRRILTKKYRNRLCSQYITRKIYTTATCKACIMYAAASR